MEQDRDRLLRLEETVGACTRCRLCETRTHTVAGEGNPEAGILFVGEGPGRDEDLQGRPFVGAAGQLLDRMLESIGLKREQVYITNIVKCRPPNNRNPEPDEEEACLPFLRIQYGLIRPEIVVCLGAVAARRLIGPEIRITRDRGKWTQKAGVWFLPTYHPAALLRDESKKREAWQDLQLLSERIKEIEKQQ